MFVQNSALHVCDTRAYAARRFMRRFRGCTGKPRTDHEMAGGAGARFLRRVWEQARSGVDAERFTEAGLSDVRTDAVGNVFGRIAGGNAGRGDGTVVVLSAASDTGVSAETEMNPRVDVDRMDAPGAATTGRRGGDAGAGARADSIEGGVAGAGDFSLGNGRRRGRSATLRGVRHFYQTDNRVARKDWARIDCAGWCGG